MTTPRVTEIHTQRGGWLRARRDDVAGLELAELLKSDHALVDDGDDWHPTTYYRTGERIA